MGACLRVAWLLCCGTWSLFKGLSAIHELRQEVAHGDVKSDNLFLGNDGFLKIGDLGSAHVGPQTGHGCRYDCALCHMHTPMSACVRQAQLPKPTSNTPPPLPTHTNAACLFDSHIEAFCPTHGSAGARTRLQSPESGPWQPPLPKSLNVRPGMTWPAWVD